MKFDSVRFTLAVVVDYLGIFLFVASWYTIIRILGIARAMDDAQLISQIKGTFEVCYNQCSSDYLASQAGVASEEVERTLKSLEREG